MTQREQILTHLKTYRVIDTKTAIQKYWCTRLSEYIRLLRQDGYKIVSTWVTNGKKNWVEYTLVELPSY